MSKGAGVRQVGVVVLAVLATGVGLGCAVEGPAFQEATASPQKSVIYLYRPNKVLGSAVTGTVNCGDYSIALGNGGYHPFTVDPGTVRCSVFSESTSSVEINAEPGKEYYVKESTGWGVLAARYYLEIPDTGVGPEEIRDCKLQ